MEELFHYLLLITLYGIEMHANISNLQLMQILPKAISIKDIANKA